MMLSYYDFDIWAKRVDLLTNRVLIVSQMLGARYDGASDSACTVTYRRGFYDVTLCGEMFARFRIYDFDGLGDALTRLDALNDGLWLLGRCGYINRTVPTFVGAAP